MSRLFLFVIMTGLGVVASLALAQDDAPKVSVDLLADSTAITPGQPFTVALRFKIAPGWHLYWLNPGDTGAAPKTQWNLPPNATAGPLEFPTPARIDAGHGLTAFGYENEVVLLTTITPGTVEPGDNGRFSISARVRWVVCRETCIAERQTVALDLPVTDAKLDHAAEFATWKAQQPIRFHSTDERTLSVLIDKTNEKQGKIEFSLRPGETPIDFFPPATDYAVFSQPTIRTDAGRRIYEILFAILPGPHDDFFGTGLVVLKNESGEQTAIEMPCEFRFPK